MSLICKLGEILETARIAYETMEDVDFQVLEKAAHDKVFSAEPENILAWGDNEKFLKYLLRQRQMAGSVQVVYIDPPFFSKANYKAVLQVKQKPGEGVQRVHHHAYKDTWEEGMEGYLIMLCIRLFLIRDLLKESGTLWVHLDWHSSHYVKVFLDEIFGDKNFINEIVWQYKSGGSSKKHFARKHDTILVYGKTAKYYLQIPKEKSYNRGMKPYRFQGVEEFCDEIGWYTMVTMKDVWNIDMVGRTSAERTGYATQKPEALLERILEAASREGDLVADFFCGSGTCGAVAEKMHRRWICCDAGALAVANVRRRIITSENGLQLVADSDKIKGAEHTKTGISFMSDSWRGAAAEIETEINENFIENTDKICFTIRLKNYILKWLMGDSRNEKVSVSDEFTDIIKDNPLALIDDWSIEYFGNGEVFCPDCTMIRQKGDITLSVQRIFSGEERDRLRVWIRTTDIFGNITYSRIL